MPNSGGNNAFEIIRVSIEVDLRYPPGQRPKAKRQKIGMLAGNRRSQARLSPVREVALGRSLRQPFDMGEAADQRVICEHAKTSTI